MKLTKVNYRSLFDLCILCLQPCNHASGICQHCRDDLPWLGERCQICALPLMDTANGITCGPCLSKKPSFTKINALFLYEFPINHLVGKIKYSGKTQYIGHLAQLISQHCLSAKHDLPSKRWTLPASVDLLVPIPMHRFSLYKRGFNQAELLAYELGKTLNIKVDTSLLVKTKATPKQMSLKREARLKNQRRAFSCTKSYSGHVVLVDDVMTTGATLEAAAQALIKAGAKRVDAIVLARTPK